MYIKPVTVARETRMDLTRLKRNVLCLPAIVCLEIKLATGFEPVTVSEK